MTDKLVFERKHKGHNGFTYDSIHCLGYYCQACNEFFIISAESKVVQKHLTPKVINKEWLTKVTDGETVDRNCLT